MLCSNLHPDRRKVMPAFPHAAEAPASARRGGGRGTLNSRILKGAPLRYFLAVTAALRGFQPLDQLRCWPCSGEDLPDRRMPAGCASSGLGGF